MFNKKSRRNNLEVYFKKQRESRRNSSERLNYILIEESEKILKREKINAFINKILEQSHLKLNEYLSDLEELKRKQEKKQRSFKFFNFIKKMQSNKIIKNVNIEKGKLNKEWNFLKKMSENNPEVFIFCLFNKYIFNKNKEDILINKGLNKLYSKISDDWLSDDWLEIRNKIHEVFVKLNMVDPSYLFRYLNKNKFNQYDEGIKHIINYPLEILDETLSLDKTKECINDYNINEDVWIQEVKINGAKIKNFTILKQIILFIIINKKLIISVKEKNSIEELNILKDTYHNLKK